MQLGENAVLSWSHHQKIVLFLKTECVEADEGTYTDTDHEITPAKAHPWHEGQVLKAGWP
jgi:hypothetical protein